MRPVAAWLVCFVALSACGDDGGGAADAAGLDGSPRFDGSPSDDGAAADSAPGLDAPVSDAGLGATGTPNPVWAFAHGGSGSVFARDVAIDSDGNIIVVGTSTGSTDYGGTVRDTALALFVAKYNSAGALLDVVHYTGATQLGVTSVAVDSSDNIIFGGYFRGSLNFGGATLSNADQFPNIFVAKLTSAFGHVFSTAYTNAAGTNDQLLDVAVDAAGNIYFTGFFQRQIDLGGNPINAAGGAGDRDTFVTKLGPTGTHIDDAEIPGAAGSQKGMHLVVEGTSVWLAVESDGKVNCGAGDTANTGTHTLLCPFTTSLVPSTATLLNGAGDNSPAGIAVATNGDVVVSGTFQDSIDFGDGSETTGSTMVDDIFVARYDSSGALLYGRVYGGAGTHHANSMALSSSGYPVVAGRLTAALGLTITTVAVTGANPNGVVFELNELANGYWGSAFGTATGATSTTAVATDASGSVIVGNFSGALDVGTGALTMSTASSEFFIARFGPPLAP